MMETEQTAGSCPTPGQAAVRTWLPSSTKGATRTPSDSASRFQGDGVRYKAKLIGMDPVPDAEGEKMCWDSMMKLKGCEAAARKQGKHKPRVWLKISSTGLKIVDERTAAVLFDHDRSRISSLTKDESDPRALAYIYQHEDTYTLFYIKMANLADPVLADVREVCQSADQETPQKPAETATQNTSLMLVNESPPSPAKVSSSSELMEVFAPTLADPPTSAHGSDQPESLVQTLSTSQILAMFPTQPLGGSPYSSPPYSPTSVPWGQQGPLGNQWAGPWSAMPGNMSAWAPPGVTVPPVGSLAQYVVNPQSGFMIGATTAAGFPAAPSSPTGYPTTLNFYPLTGAPGAPTLDQNPL
ncbi:disabled homolog 2-like isoform X2 [Parambassis ranga]|uniref:Disabled homolog 2-like isoform X2 n=1 Tax=Parambassis ranga TaxID=210632 RepID=A0A6P7IF52_9TELE|nr:disabled homolog 2-like isoform X2 [Parambassis ranga]